MCSNAQPLENGVLVNWNLFVVYLHFNTVSVTKLRTYLIFSLFDQINMTVQRFYLPRPSFDLKSGDSNCVRASDNANNNGQEFIDSNYLLKFTVLPYSTLFYDKTFMRVKSVKQANLKHSYIIILLVYVSITTDLINSQPESLNG